MTKSRSVNEYLNKLKIKTERDNELRSDDHKALASELYDKVKQALIVLGNSDAAECVKNHALQQLDVQSGAGIYNSPQLGVYYDNY